MKYDYLKGSEKDFEGAPEWATMKCHCTIGDPCEIRDENVAFSNGIVRGSRWVDTFGDGGEGVICSEEQWHAIAERRPITEPVWDGEGLPPVGSKVMTKSGEGVIDYVGVGVIVYTNNDGQWSVRCDSLDFSLSAIRSPEDVAREVALNAMSDASIELDSDNPLIARIYSAIAEGKIPGVKLESAQ